MQKYIYVYFFFLLLILYLCFKCERNPDREMISSNGIKAQHIPDFSPTEQCGAICPLTLLTRAHVICTPPATAAREESEFDSLQPQNCEKKKSLCEFCEFLVCQ